MLCISSVQFNSLECSLYSINVETVSQWIHVKQETLWSRHSDLVLAFGLSFWGLYSIFFFFGLHAGTLIVLKHPYPKKVEEPSIYESVRVHTAMQTGRSENDLVPTAPSVSGHPSAHRAHCPKAITYNKLHTFYSTFVHIKFYLGI